MATKRAVSPFSAAVTAALLLGLAACSVNAVPEEPILQPAAATTPAPSASSGTASNPRGSGETAAVPIDNATGGKVALSDGTQLEVPAGALPPGVDTITVTSSTAPAPTEYKAIAPIYVFGPDGTVFLKPVKISFPVTIPAGTKTEDLTILWSRSGGKPGFDMVPATFTATGGSSYIVSGEVNHFSEGTCGAKFAEDPHPPADPYQ